MKDKYLLPPRTTNSQGRQRSVGFELEFSNLDVAEVADIIADTFAGTPARKSDIEYRIHCGDIGDFTVELDWHLGKIIADKRYRESSAPNGEQDPLMEGLKWLAGQVVPVEIVCPPIALGELSELDTMVDRLREAGAEGTDESVVYAFGVHINPEIPDPDPASLVRYLQAFALSQKWLIDKNKIDPVRKMTPYIKPYPAQYLDTVLGYSDGLSLETIIDDYFEHNATRNRALDMLPLWKHLQPASFARNNFDDTLTHSRPTFHYRLPNCEIDSKNWYLSSAWNLWCVVEHLAEDRALRNRLIDHYRKEQEKGFLIKEMSWHNQLEKLYADLLSE